MKRLIHSKPLSRRSESCENCFCFDNQSQEEVDIDFSVMFPSLISTRKIERSSSETTCILCFLFFSSIVSMLSDAQLPFSDTECFSGDSPPISTI